MEDSNGTSILAEDEFYDAVETGSQVSDDSGSTRRNSNVSLIPTPNSATASHRIWPEIQKVVSDQIRYARMGLGKDKWQLFVEEGEMKMYRREEEIRGMVMDPVKACHVVKGVTGHEMCHYFFRPEFRYEWETTLEKMSVAETIADDTIIFWQIHKSIWPVQQRDALFWSHLTQVPDPNDKDAAQNIWVVVNNSTDLPEYPPNTGKYIRLFLTVCMICQTLVTPPKTGSAVTRQDISCKITYCSVVNPGGLIPCALLRTVYKREYPKFLKNFTSYVIKQCKDKPIMY